MSDSGTGQLEALRPNPRIYYFYQGKKTYRPLRFEPILLLLFTPSLPVSPVKSLGVHLKGSNVIKPLPGGLVIISTSHLFPSGNRQEKNTYPSTAVLALGSGRGGLRRRVRLSRPFALVNGRNRKLSTLGAKRTKARFNRRRRRRRGGC